MQHWTIEVAARSKEQLLFDLAYRKVHMNAFATMLMMSPNWEDVLSNHKFQVTEVTVAELGFCEGAMLKQVFEAAKVIGLEPCPLSLAAYLRLSYLDQPMDTMITVASELPEQEETYPRGLYLKADSSGLWLRGYRASDDWVWPPDSRFAFIKSV